MRQLIPAHNRSLNAQGDPAKARLKDPCGKNT